MGRVEDESLPLAWKLVTAAGRPLAFLQAPPFQWINPKAWVMALTALGAYALDAGAAGVLTVTVRGRSCWSGPPCNLLWVAAARGCADWSPGLRRCDG